MRNNFIQYFNLFFKSIMFGAIILLVESFLYGVFHDFLEKYKHDIQNVLFISLIVVSLFCILNYASFRRTLLRMLNTNAVTLFFLIVLFLYYSAIIQLKMPFDLATSPVLWGWTGTSILLILSLRLLTSFFYFNESSKAIQQRLLSDSPTAEATPLTGTQLIAYKRLEKALDNSEISIALTGAWGSGKTKILHELVENKSGVIWFNFQPWIYTSEEALVKDFYIQLSQKLEDAVPTLIKPASILPAVKRVVGTVLENNTLRTIFDLGVEQVGKSLTPDKVIAKRIENESIEVVVIIDDTERVHNPSIINRTLQLAHYIKKIKGIRLIMAFERDVISRALPVHAMDKNEFIEKFFEIEIPLSSATTEETEYELRRLIPRSLQPDYIRHSLIIDIKSHRAIRRIANEYILYSGNFLIHDSNNMKNLPDIINRDDFLAITHIKLKYPQIYRDIDENRSLYTQPDSMTEEYMWRMMRDDDENNKERAEHFNELFTRAGISGLRRKRISDFLADIFPEASKALGSLSTKNNSENVMRKERRLGLRMILNAYFSLTQQLDQVIENEKAAKAFIDILEGSYTPQTLDHAVKKLLQYMSTLNHGTWDAPLYLLTAELENGDSYDESIVDVVRALLIGALELDYTYDDKRKTRMAGQAFYILTGRLLYRVEDEKKREYVERLDILDIARHSKTPFGSLLIARLDLSSDANEVAKLLNDKEKRELKNIARRKFESYYIEEKHNLVTESEKDTQPFLEYGWRDMTSHYMKGLGMYKAWLSELQLYHPSVYLDRYTMRTIRGNWAFKDHYHHSASPIISKQTLNEILDIITNIEKSPNLTDEDIKRIKMVQKVANQNQDKSSINK